MLINVIIDIIQCSIKIMCYHGLVSFLENCQRPDAAAQLGRSVARDDRRCCPLTNLIRQDIGKDGQTSWCAQRGVRGQVDIATYFFFFFY